MRTALGNVLGTQKGTYWKHRKECIGNTERNGLETPKGTYWEHRTEHMGTYNRTHGDAIVNVKGNEWAIPSLFFY